MKKDNFFWKLWDSIWPLCIYVIAQNIFGIIFIPIKQPILAILFAALVCIPFYLQMYQKEKVYCADVQENVRIENKDLIAISVSCASLALALNNIIAITPLPYLFSGYEKTNEVIYSGNIFVQILSAGILGCIVEEISMRGVLYLRLKKHFGKRTALIGSALLFGMYHLNVVQMVYATVLGLFFAWLYERYQSLWAPVLGHMSANLFILLLAGSSFAEHIMNTWMGFCLITCICLLIFYYGFRYMKQTAVKIRLLFEEKEPDTLDQLTEEYKRKDTEDEK